MKKTVFIFVLLFLVMTVCFAQREYFEKTEHFKIIYSGSSEKNAKRIFENCEEIYQQLCLLFKKDPELFIPVTLTDSVNEMNAYFSPFPANHIVLYDTANDNINLLNLKDDILSVFRHELTHAFNYNLRSSFWSGLANVFGDYISTAPVNENNFLMEGLAVYSESLSGYGRLNDPYYMQYVRQVKAEGLFPAWTEVNGGLDIYPYGSTAYLYGSAFLQYLADTYGEDKVIEFFHTANHLHFFELEDSLLNEVFGKKPSQLWEEFERSLQIPGFFEKPDTLNSFYSLYSRLKYEDGFYYVADVLQNRIIRFNKDFTDEKILFTPLGNMKSFDVLSKTFLVTEYDSLNGCIALYDYKGELVYRLKSSNKGENGRVYRLARFIDENSFVVWNTARSDSFLSYFKISRDKFGNILSFSEEQTLDLNRYFGSYCAVTDICMAGLRTVLSVSVSGKDYLCCLDTQSMKLSVFENLPEIRIFSLSYDKDNDTLYFSYCSSLPSNAFTRCGKIVFSEKNFSDYYESILFLDNSYAANEDKTGSEFEDEIFSITENETERISENETEKTVKENENEETVEIENNTVREDVSEDIFETETVNRNTSEEEYKTEAVNEEDVSEDIFGTETVNRNISEEEYKTEVANEDVSEDEYEKNIIGVQNTKEIDEENTDEGYFTADLYLSETDILGGVMCPVTDGYGNFLYISELTYGKLLSKSSGFDFSQLCKIKVPRDSNLPSFSEEHSDNKLSQKKYSSISNLMKGAIIPLGFESDSQLSGPGITYITEDPTESILLSASAGYDISKNNGTIFANFTFENNELFIPIGLSFSFINQKTAKGQFDPELVFLFQMSKTLFFARESHNLKLQNSLYIKERAGFFSFEDNVQINYSNLFSTGLGYFDVKGLSMNLQLRNLYPTFTFMYNFDRLLSVKNTRRLTFNLPFVAGFAVSSDFVNHAVSLSLFGKVCLFAYEIQDKIPVIQLYIRRFVLDAGISHNIVYYTNGLKGVASTTISSTLYFHILPAIGTSVDSSTFLFKIGPRLDWTLGTKPVFSFRVISDFISF